MASRLPGTENAKLPTGEIEVQATAFTILNEAKTPPFYINEPGRAGRRVTPPQVPLSRHPPRADAAAAAPPEPPRPGNPRGPPRERLRRGGDPEPHQVDAGGCARLHRPVAAPAGSVYALPQSPQQLKQLLMVAGVDRYFQIARCFRDEDLRGDRQPEFTQLDLEMSFVDEAAVMDFVEAMTIAVTKAVVPDRPMQATPFPRFTYEEAMERFGLGQAGPAVRDGAGGPRAGSAGPDGAPASGFPRLRRGARRRRPGQGDRGVPGLADAPRSRRSTS